MERQDAITDSSDWTFKPLKDLDALLRCPICFDYYKTAMMIPNCSHNYCSVCIRRFLMNKPHCPTCSAPVTESQMRNNRTLDDLVKQFSGDRKEFMDLVRQGSTSMKTRNGLRIAPSQPTKHSTLAAPELGTPSSVHVPEPPSPSLLDEGVVFVREDGGGESGQRWSDDETNEAGRTPGSFDFRREEDKFGAKFEADQVCHLKEFHPHAFTPKRPSAGKTSPEIDPQVSWNPETPSISFVRFPYTPETPLLARTKSESATKISLTPLKVATSTPVRKRASSGVYTPVGSKGGGGETGGPSPSTNSAERVDCPACGLKVNHKFINSHLDVCLSRKKSTSNTSSGHHLPKLPKLVFNIMNDKQLKKKLKEYLLSTQGTRQALISRLQEYHLYYNAQYDSLDPKTPQEIAQEVEKAERAKLSKKSTSTPTSSVARRGSTEEEVEQRRKEYERANKDHYAQLIAKAREGKKKATRREEGSLFGESSKGMDEILAVDSSHSEDEALISAEKMETTVVPESPKLRMQKRRSSKRKQKATIVARTSESEEEEQPQGEEDSDFLPSTPFRTRKKRKRY